jgi:hypothetical protein
LSTAVRTLIPKPTPEQMCISRVVCFFCGASPLGEGIKLSLCGGCQCVAYCSRGCQAADWAGEHRLECKRREPGVSESGIVVLPASKLDVNRAATEAQKPRSMKLLVQGSPRDLVITRTLGMTKTGTSVLFPMAWVVEYAPTGGAGAGATGAGATGGLR